MTRSRSLFLPLIALAELLPAAQRLRREGYDELEALRPRAGARFDATVEELERLIARDDAPRCHPERSRGIPRRRSESRASAEDPSTSLGMTRGQTRPALKALERRVRDEYDANVGSRDAAPRRHSEEWR
jgi:hypothetical protein